MGRGPRGAKPGFEIGEHVILVEKQNHRSLHLIYSGISSRRSLLAHSSAPKQRLTCWIPSSRSLFTPGQSAFRLTAELKALRWLADLIEFVLSRRLLQLRLLRRVVS